MSGEAVCLLSGGLDSVVMLRHLHCLGMKVSGLCVDYGQRHRKESLFAKEACETLGAPFALLDLSPVKGLFGKNSQTTPDIAVPEVCAYDEVTVVPGRNLILLSLASAYAQKSIPAQAVAFAPNKQDHRVYADCRPDFVGKLREIFSLTSSVELITPFLYWDKAEVVRRGAAIGVAFEKTWSCYKGGEVHCGLCAACRTRKDAFAQAGIKDPTEYSCR